MRDQEPTDPTEQDSPPPDPHREPDDTQEPEPVPA
jgi:hypothetical protein